MMRLSIIIPRRQINLQRWLMPRQIILLLNPVTALIRKLQIKLEYDQSQNQTHLTVCKTIHISVSSLFWSFGKLDNVLSSNAVSRTKVERLEGLSLVI
jgi:hypothetical protein